MEDIFQKYKQIFLEPKEANRIKNYFIELKDFEYYKNEQYNPIFMRVLMNSIYAINSIFFDSNDNLERLKIIFNEMPFGFGLIKTDNISNLVLYSTSNDENFFKSLNDIDFLVDIIDDLKGKVQEDFTYRTEGQKLNKTYSGLIYEENVILNIKNYLNKDFIELPNLIFYFNEENNSEKIEKIKNIFGLQEKNNNIINSIITINLKFSLWNNNNTENESNRNITTNKKYFGYNEIDFVFLAKDKKIIESNRIYKKIFSINTDNNNDNIDNIIFKKNYAYFVEIKLTFPQDPEEQIKRLFNKAKKFFLLYNDKYNFEKFGIILVYNSIESFGTNFLRNYNIQINNRDIELYILYIHIGVNVSNINLLSNKVFKTEKELEETKKKLEKTNKELEKTNKKLENVKNNNEFFQKLILDSLKKMLPHQKDFIDNIEDLINRNKMISETKDNNEKISTPTFEFKINKIENKSILDNKQISTTTPIDQNNNKINIDEQNNPINKIQENKTSENKTDNKNYKEINPNIISIEQNNNKINLDEQHNSINRIQENKICNKTNEEINLNTISIDQNNNKKSIDEQYKNIQKKENFEQSFNSKNNDENKEKDKKEKDKKANEIDDKEVLYSKENIIEENIITEINNINKGKNINDNIILKEENINNKSLSICNKNNNISEKEIMNNAINNNINIKNKDINEEKIKKENISFEEVALQFKNIVIECNNKKRQTIVKALNIFNKYKNSISDFNKKAKASYLKGDTPLKKYLFNTLFQDNLEYSEKIKNIFNEIIGNYKSEISNEFIILKNLIFGNSNNNPHFFKDEKNLKKSFLKCFIYNTIFLLENDFKDIFDIYYISCLNNIIEFLNKLENNNYSSNLAEFSFIIYRKYNYSIKKFISTFIEGMNMDNRIHLLQKEGSKYQSFISFIKNFQ